jgi:hypothetical protein
MGRLGRAAQQRGRTGSQTRNAPRVAGHASPTRCPRCWWAARAWPAVRCGAVRCGASALSGRRVSSVHRRASLHLTSRRLQPATAAVQAAADETAAGNGRGRACRQALGMAADGPRWVAVGQGGRKERAGGAAGAVDGQRGGCGSLRVGCTRNCSVRCSSSSRRRRRVSSGPSVVPAHDAYLAAPPHVARRSVRNGPLDARARERSAAARSRAVRHARASADVHGDGAVSA